MGEWATLDAQEISTLVREGTLTPISALTDVDEDDKAEYLQGIVNPHTPNFLTMGYTTQLLPRSDDPSRSAKTQARALHSNYLVFPTKYSFPKVVRIMSMVKRFVTAFRRKWDPNFRDTKGTDLPAPFKTFLCTPSHKPLPTTMLYGAHASYIRPNVTASKLRR